MASDDSLLRFATPNVPLVGQPHRIISWFPTTLISCECDAAKGGHHLIHLHNFGVPAQCERCKRGYVAAGIAVTNTPDGPQYRIVVNSFVVPEMPQHE